MRLSTQASTGRLFSRLRMPALAGLLALLCVAPARAASEQQSLEELRNTVVNLLQALVSRGVMTHEQAEQLVKQAQEKASADLAARAQEEQGAVRVPYVPQIVKDQIAKQVEEEIRPAVAADVVKEAKSEGWGVPGAMPDWLRRTRLAGEITLRGQQDLYGHGNAQYFLLDFGAINQAGGIAKAGLNAFLNVSQDRERARARARFGAQIELSDSLQAGIRIASGSLQDPGSEMQTLGQESGRYTVGFDQIYIRWDGRGAQRFPYLSAIGGRLSNPFFSPTELVYQRDLAFEGAAFSGRAGLGDGSAEQSYLYMNLGGFPVQEVPLVNKENKWLLGAQVGSSLRFGEAQRLELAAAYYDFRNAEGQPNSLESTLTNFTAPQFVRWGNSMFDISNTADPTVNLFGLASRFRVANVGARYTLPLGRYAFVLDADAARNVGFNHREILLRTGQDIAPRIKGYVAEAAFGSPLVSRAGDWRALFGYRYVQRDAVLDALTDPDFHEGGTNSAGYFTWLDVGLANNFWSRLRYLSGNEIEGPRYHLDVFQFDLNVRF
jgi:hypothetical protein